MLAREGFPENHFYDDKHKYHVCLPTKTGSTNWLRMLFSLYKYAGYKGQRFCLKLYKIHKNLTVIDYIK